MTRISELNQSALESAYLTAYSKWGKLGAKHLAYVGSVILTHTIVSTNVHNTSPIPWGGPFPKHYLRTNLHHTWCSVAIGSIHYTIMYLSLRLRDFFMLLCSWILWWLYIENSVILLIAISTNDHYSQVSFEVQEPRMHYDLTQETYGRNIILIRGQYCLYTHFLFHFRFIHMYTVTTVATIPIIHHVASIINTPGTVCL